MSLEEPDGSQKGPSKGLSVRWAALIISIYVTFTCIIVLILDFIHLIPDPLVNNLFAFICAICGNVAVVALINPREVIEKRLHPIWAKMRRGLKADILLSYVSSDRQWKRWMQEKLEQWGYDVVLLKWERRINFQKKLRKTEKKVKRTLSIVSPEMLELAESDPDWFHSWKKRNHADGPNGLICIRVKTCELLQQVDSNLALINLAGKNVVEEAEEELRVWLLNGPGKQKPLPTKDKKDQEWRYPGAYPPGWNLPGRNENFIGREVELQDLLDTLLTEKRGIILHGLRGIGKTEIAKEYAYRNQDKYANVFWLSVGMPSKYGRELRCIVEGLKIIEISKVIGMSIKTLEREFSRWLSQHDDWLLILDECQQEGKIEKFHPRPMKGKLLITASVKFTNEFKQIQLEEMDEQEAKLFLLRQSGLDQRDGALKKTALHHEKDIAEIVNRLGGMPEALKAASLYIKNRRSPGQFLRDYQQYMRKLQSMGQQVPDKQAQGVEIEVIYSWWLYFDKVKKQSREAAEVLNYCVLLDPSAIHMEIIENIPNLGLSAEQLTSAIAKLAQFFLVKRNGDDILSINPHIQNYFQDWLDDGTKRRLSIDIVQALSKTLQTPSIANLRRSRDYDYTIQVEACEELIDKYQIDHSEIADLYDIYGYYLIEHAEYEEAQKYLQKGLDIRERFYKEAQNNGLSALDEEEYLLKIATSKSYQAELLYAQGEYQKAEQLWEEVLSKREKVLGRYNLDVATTCYHLARLAYIGGGTKTAEYERLCQRLDIIWQNILKPGSCPQVQSPIAMINLLKQQGSICYMQRNYEKSIKKYEEAIDQARNAKKSAVPGFEEETFTIEIDLCKARRGRCLVASNQKDEYERLTTQYERLLKTFKENFGEYHPETAQMHLNLGDVHRKRGDRDSAEVSYKQAKDIYTEIAPGHELIKYIQKQINSLGGSN